MGQEQSAPRRRQARSVRTRAAIIDAALRSWAARGYAAVTVDEICADAGVAKGAFYFHFRSKAELLIEVATPHAELAERVMDEALLRRSPVDGTLLGQLTDALAESCRSTPRALVRQGVAELLAGFGSEASQAPSEAGPQGIRRLFVRFYRAAQEQGQLPEVYRAEELASITSWTVLQGAMLWGAGYYARQTLHTVLRRTSLLIWEGAMHADSALLATLDSRPGSV